MFYADNEPVRINDVVTIPAKGFAGRVAGIFPPEGDIEIISDNPADASMRLYVAPTSVLLQFHTQSF